MSRMVVFFLVTHQELNVRSVANFIFKALKGESND